MSNRIWHELIKPQLITWLLCIVLCRIYGSCPILPLLLEPNSYVCVTDSNRFAKFIWCKPKRIEQENLGGSRYILKILYGNPIMFSFLSFFFFFFFFHDNRSEKWQCDKNNTHAYFCQHFQQRVHHLDWDGLLEFGSVPNHILYCNLVTHNET